MEHLNYFSPPGCLSRTRLPLKHIIIIHIYLIVLCLLKGEDLRKSIGATAYVECSAKTQQVITFSLSISIKSKFLPQDFDHLHRN